MDRKLNHDIKAPQMLVVWEKPRNGGTDSVLMSRAQALRIAKESNLDLVMIDPSRTPPVCKLMDYKTEQYRRMKQQKAKRTRKQQIKEVHLKGMIAPHDLERKVKTVVGYLGRGDIVKVVLEAPMALLRRNLNCLDVLQAKLEEQIDPNFAVISQGKTSNKLTRRELMCKPRKSIVIRKATVGRSEASDGSERIRREHKEVDEAGAVEDQHPAERAARVKRRQAHEASIAMAAEACTRIKDAMTSNSASSPPMPLQSPTALPSRPENDDDFVTGNRILHLGRVTWEVEEWEGKGGPGYAEDTVAVEERKDVARENFGEDGFEEGSGREASVEQDQSVWYPSDVEELTLGREYPSLDDDEDPVYDAERSRKKKRKDNTTDSLDLEDGPMLVGIGGRSAKARLKGGKGGKRRGDKHNDDDWDWEGPAGDDDADIRNRSRRRARADGDGPRGSPRPRVMRPGRGGRGGAGGREQGSGRGRGHRNGEGRRGASRETGRAPGRCEGKAPGNRLNSFVNSSNFEAMDELAVETNGAPVPTGRAWRRHQANKPGGQDDMARLPERFGVGYRWGVAKGISSSKDHSRHGVGSEDAAAEGLGSRFPPGGGGGDGISPDASDGRRD